MNKPFLIIQLRPERAVADNELEAIVRYGKLGASEFVRIRAECDGPPMLDLDDFAAIIVGGSPYDISKPASSKSDAQRKVETAFMRLLDRVVERDFPFLGACSGSGLLGRHCGAQVSGRYAEPVGGTEVELTDAGTDDALLTGFPRRFRVLLGHKEACDDVPPRATLLVTSRACPVQMFRVGDNVYATQFHPEADAAGFALRIDVYKEHGYFQPETADELKRRIAGEDTPFARRILSRFVARYR
jgi:GMP synthase (glutamine-hydrolysing)